MIREPSLHNLHIKRAFQAPRHLVWRAWTEQAALTQWICPKDFITLYFEIDLKVGGAWRTSMQSPEGQIYTMFGTYQIIDEPNRLTFSHTWEDNLEHGHEPEYYTTVTIELEEIDGQTTMTFIQSGFRTIEGRDGHNGGWSGAFDKLGFYIKGSKA